MRAQRITLAVCVAACLYFAWACRTVAEDTGTFFSAALAWPLGPVATGAVAVVGKHTGDKAADALGADPEVTLKQAEKIIYRDKIVREPYEVDKPFIPLWAWIAIGILVWSRREHILGWFADAGRSIANLAPLDALKATGARLLATVHSGKATAMARSVSTAIGDKRRAKLNPLTNIVKTSGPHE